MNKVFVFGSNLAGIHGRGSAKEAHTKWGAQYGVGVGRTGHAYAIPTKDKNFRTLKLWQIEEHVKVFLKYAKLNLDEEFLVVAIGCGLAGYTPAQIAPFFKEAGKNVTLPPEFLGVLE